MKKEGFSLVELSIVLVILGLLTGGILTGQSLIRAAELRSVTTEFQTYQTAVHTFRDKYFALPGDMTNATDFWGAAHSTPATCKTTASTGTETCNGNGDGRIRTDATASNEWFRFWQHLANAGLIEGSYTGVGGSGGTQHAVIGTNIPASKLRNGGWSIETLGAYGGNSNIFGLDYGTLMSFGSATSASPSYGALLTPEEVWNIDSKLDDGRPATGKVVIRFWDDCTDATAATGLDSHYLLSNNVAGCAIHFPKVF